MLRLSLRSTISSPTAAPSSEITAQKYSASNEALMEAMQKQRDCHMRFAAAEPQVGGIIGRLLATQSEFYLQISKTILAIGLFVDPLSMIMIVVFSSCAPTTHL